MIQITEKQFQELKDLVAKAEPSSEEYGSHNGHYYYRCCNMDSPYEHRKDCPKTAWNKLDWFLQPPILES